MRRGGGLAPRALDLGLRRLLDRGSARPALRQSLHHRRAHRAGGRACLAHSRLAGRRRDQCAGRRNPPAQESDERLIMETKITIRLLAGAVLTLTATAALADTAGPAPKPPAHGPAISGFFSPFPFQGGEAIYKGAVGAGAYPALARNENLETAAYPVSIVLKGQKAMPFFGMQLNDQQIADVVNYVRSHFGNKYKDKVKPEDVKLMR